ncbi:hypothetical protein V6N13_111332 [Hibiscus sabdariffa]
MTLKSRLGQWHFAHQLFVYCSFEIHSKDLGTFFAVPWFTTLLYLTCFLLILQVPFLKLYCLNMAFRQTISKILLRLNWFLDALLTVQQEVSHTISFIFFRLIAGLMLSQIHGVVETVLQTTIL